MTENQVKSYKLQSLVAVRFQIRCTADNLTAKTFNRIFTPLGKSPDYQLYG